MCQIIYQSVGLKLPNSMSTRTQNLSPKHYTDPPDQIQLKKVVSLIGRNWSKALYFKSILWKYFTDFVTVRARYNNYLIGWTISSTINGKYNWWVYQKALYSRRRIRREDITPMHVVMISIDIPVSPTRLKRRWRGFWKQEIWHYTLNSKIGQSTE